MQPLSNNELKTLRSLKMKKYRYKTGHFIAEGYKTVAELVASDYPIIELFASPEWLAKNESVVFKTKIRLIPSRQIKEISQLSTQAGIFALVQIPNYQIDSSIFKQKYTLLLDKINDPGNLGTLIRLADWFGLPQIICSKDSVDCFNQKTIQATMGSIARIPVLYTDLLPLIRQNKALPVYAALLEGQSLYQSTFKGQGFLLLGSESHGISPELLEEPLEKITIPRFGEAESLNVAMAGGILLSEMMRQKI